MREDGEIAGLCTVWLYMLYTVWRDLYYIITSMPKNDKRLFEAHGKTTLMVPFYAFACYSWEHRVLAHERAIHHCGIKSVV